MERLYWNNDWKFAETWEEAMKEAVYPENKMEDVRLPHTCKELPYHYFDEHAYQMLCGYRRHFMAPEAWQGKSVELTFEGVAHDAVVYVNGTEVKAHHCGYTAFSVELAKYLKIWGGQCTCGACRQPGKFEYSAVRICHRLHDFWRDVS